MFGSYVTRGNVNFQAALKDCLLKLGCASVCIFVHLLYIYVFCRHYNEFLCIYGIHFISMCVSL